MALVVFFLLLVVRAVLCPFSIWLFSISASEFPIAMRKITGQKQNQAGRDVPPELPCENKRGPRSTCRSYASGTQASRRLSENFLACCSITSTLPSSRPHILRAHIIRCFVEGVIECAGPDWLVHSTFAPGRGSVEVRVSLPPFFPNKFLPRRAHCLSRISLGVPLPPVCHLPCLSALPCHAWVRR